MERRRRRRGINLVESLVVFGVIAFWTTLVLEETQKQAPWRSRELCQAGRVRLRQTLDLYRTDHGISIETLDQNLVHEALLARGYLTAPPRCPAAPEGSFPFALAPDGTVTCQHHPEGKLAAAESEPPGKAHSTIATLVEFLGHATTTTLRVGLCLIPLIWIRAARNRQQRQRRSDYDEASSCVKDWLVENQHRTATRRSSGSIRRMAPPLIEFEMSLPMPIVVSDQARCPVCATQGGLGAECPSCGTPHHEECFHYNRGCGIYGCERSP